MTNWIDIAEKWLTQDPDAETRAELATLIDAAKSRNSDALSDLQNRFESRLDFGTAGLRGELGAGTNRMNRVLVAQAAAGIARWLKTKVTSHEVPSVVIGYDGRKNSKQFATDSAEIFAGYGFHAILLSDKYPTPVLAHAINYFDTHVGIMVTASHNPANDNGYKVYLGKEGMGGQIVPPVDAEIAAEIIAVADSVSFSEHPKGAYEIAENDVVEDYITRTAGIAKTPGEIKFVYTAMHGVGWDVFNRTVARAGFPEPIPVPEQRDPDPLFPTAPFPNPEEKGALDLSFALAKEVDADLIIANDPDADRLSVAIPTQTGWRQMTGNEVGVILGWNAATKNLRAGDSQEATLACSLVSSPALAQIADNFELNFAETLTGFKYIAKVPKLIFGYEEALGYLVDPDKVKDKDGISAAIEFLSIASALKKRGISIQQQLELIAAQIGGYASGQVSIRVSDLSKIGLILESFRETPPTEISGLAVTRIDDFQKGVAGFPLTNMLRIWLGDNARVIIRPSGTEPKLKAYIDTWSEDGTGTERLTNAEALVSQIHIDLSDTLSKF